MVDGVPWKARNAAFDIDLGGALSADAEEAELGIRSQVRSLSHSDC